MLLSLLFSVAMAQPPDIEERSFPCTRIFRLNEGRESARVGHFEQAFPWTHFENGGFALGRDLQVEHVVMNDTIVDAYLQLFRGPVAYKIFLTRRPIQADFAIYNNPFLHGLPDRHILKPLLNGKFHVFIGEDVAFVVSTDLERIGICPRATLDWHQVRAVLFRFMSDPRIVDYLNCGHLLMGPRPRG